MSDQDKKDSPATGSPDKIEVEELDDKSLEEASGGTISQSQEPNGVQCYC